MVGIVGVSDARRRCLPDIDGDIRIAYGATAMETPNAGRSGGVGLDGDDMAALAFQHLTDRQEMKDLAVKGLDACPHGPPLRSSLEVPVRGSDRYQVDRDIGKVCSSSGGCLVDVFKVQDGGGKICRFRTEETGAGNAIGRNMPIRPGYEMLVVVPTSGVSIRIEKYRTASPRFRPGALLANLSCCFIDARHSKLLHPPSTRSRHTHSVVTCNAVSSIFQLKENTCHIQLPRKDQLSYLEESTLGTTPALSFNLEKEVMDDSSDATKRSETLKNKAPQNRTADLGTISRSKVGTGFGANVPLISGIIWSVLASKSQCSTRNTGDHCGDFAATSYCDEGVVWLPLQENEEYCIETCRCASWTETTMLILMYSASSPRKRKSHVFVASSSSNASIPRSYSLETRIWKSAGANSIHPEFFPCTPVSHRWTFQDLEIIAKEPPRSLPKLGELWWCCICSSRQLYENMSQILTFDISKLGPRQSAIAPYTIKLRGTLDPLIGHERTRKLFCGPKDLINTECMEDRFGARVAVGHGYRTCVQQTTLPGFKSITVANSPMTTIGEIPMRFPDISPNHGFKGRACPREYRMKDHGRDGRLCDPWVEGCLRTKGL
ncbi:uncharacterized protein MYCFIDRAFT_180480 [Pseudocercospora fijiensis CIRAD86]|uniref:Uncharacterized protein n=1 Tax=Pseudocercospora fijiensis (strain CIRAD86) TaxID=383855 RepID=M2ZY02_PSEFD|nr:uncharacterized protein MYCFIDRAFT_180480 [Pseudocercospora fijiensis CIRAD86]EME76996.1 hypothetical protein MYCFIDRAFT_180480 [Pseudocercospora fijiensis CIRAD86]